MGLIGRRAMKRGGGDFSSPRRPSATRSLRVVLSHHLAAQRTAPRAQRTVRGAQKREQVPPLLKVDGGSRDDLKKGSTSRVPFQPCLIHNGAIRRWIELLVYHRVVRPRSWNGARRCTPYLAPEG